jgi:hypothetical protein
MLFSLPILKTKQRDFGTGAFLGDRRFYTATGENPGSDLIFENAHFSKFAGNRPAILEEGDQSSPGFVLRCSIESVLTLLSRSE